MTDESLVDRNIREGRAGTTLSTVQGRRFEVQDYQGLLSGDRRMGIRIAVKENAFAAC